MMTHRTTLRRTSGLAALALAASLGLAACGSDDTGAGSQGSSTESPKASEDTSSMQPTDEMSQGASDPAAQTFGPGCSQVPANGAGSFQGMATEPVATAASANPLLTTLVKGVDQAGLVDTLNSAQEITVFAPTDDAFAKIPTKDMNAVMADKKKLGTLLSHHVVEGKLTPEDVAGQHRTLAGDMLEVSGSGEQFTVGDEQAAVLCGNIPTANATVYVIDTVLMP